VQNSIVQTTISMRFSTVICASFDHLVARSRISVVKIAQEKNKVGNNPAKVVYLSGIYDINGLQNTKDMPLTKTVITESHQATSIN
jgi:hypothetical protein